MPDFEGRVWRRHLSMVSLIASHGFVLVLALVQSWSPSVLMAVYFGESIIIGVHWVERRKAETRGQTTN